MSRRESRASLNARQNDALFEFENFKKKFLLANKHITKLNSTLSVRIEELNAQITTLYTENLRLRASEIALATQLKREREKSWKVMADAEAATFNLTKHLSYLRQSLNIQESSPTPPTPPSPQARRPQPNPNFSPSTPQGSRISRPPNIPGIYEDDEPCPSSSEQDPGKPPSSARRKTTKAKPRLSASKLPLPSRVASPPPLPTPSQTPHHVDLSSIATAAKRKASRRQSGLLTVNTDSLSVPRAASPAFGSPIRLEAGRAEEAEEAAVVNGDVEVEVLEVEIADSTLKKEKRKSKPKERESEGEKDGAAVESTRSREKKRQRDEDDGMDAPKFKLKDVTNSRTALQPIDNTVRDQVEVEAPSVARAFLSNLPEPTSRPNSRGSSSPAPPVISEADAAAQGGRERRTRKSVNYAEPKLNTKMRKPDPAPGSEPARPAPPKKRSSAAAVMVTAIYKPSDDNGNDADNDTEARSSLELPLRGSNGNYINPELFPLPPSRPGSSIAGLFSPGTSRTSGSSSTASASSSSGGPTPAVRKTKSRPQLILDEEESDDGVEADEEYIPPGRKSASSWVNVEGRRKAGGTSSSSSSSKRSSVVVDEERRLQEVDGRRHSMAV